METILKQAREVGTSAGVLLPRSWLNKQVVVTLFQPSKEKMAQDIMSFLFKEKLNEEAKGIYLFGSYSRGDFDFNSDIDILVITKTINKLVNYNNYEILFVSEKSFLKNISNSLIYMSILKEVEVILNEELISKYKIGKIKLNTKKILQEIDRMLKINKENIKMYRENNLNIPDGVAYSAVLRLRELYLIKCIFHNKSYQKKDFLELAGDKPYSAYLRVKRNEREFNSISSEELAKIIKLSEKWLKELKG